MTAEPVALESRPSGPPSPIADCGTRSRKASAAAFEGVAAGYIRVSTREQADSGLGLEAQRRVIESEAARRDWRLSIYLDSAVSAKSLDGRPGLAQALADLDAGRAQVLVVSRLDRLSRSVQDFAGLVERSKRNGWALVAIDLGVDMTTPDGELFASIRASVAQWERRLIGQRTREAMAIAKARGVHCGRPREISPDVLMRITNLRRGGLSAAAIARHLNNAEIPTARGATTWYGSTVSRILKQPPIHSITDQGASS